MNHRPGQRDSRGGLVLGFLALHVFLALLWTWLVGPDGPRFAVGLVVGLLALAVGARSIGSAVYLRALAAAATLLGLFAADLVLSNLHLARDILRPRPRFVPAILAFDVGELDPLQTALLVSLVSLTPGSVCIDLDDAERTLFVHTLYAGDEREALRRIRRYAVLLRALEGAPPARREAP